MSPSHHLSDGQYLGVYFIIIGVAVIFLVGFVYIWWGDDANDEASLFYRDPLLEKKIAERACHYPQRICKQTIDQDTKLRKVLKEISNYRG